MDRPPKKLRRLLRQLADRAYEEELRRELEPLHEAFEQWKRRALNSFELSDLIHNFHQGPSRRLFTKHNGANHEMIVALAIVNGILDRNKVRQELLDHLQSKIEFYDRLATEDD